MIVNLCANKLTLATEHHRISEYLSNFTVKVFPETKVQLKEYKNTS